VILGGDWKLLSFSCRFVQLRHLVSTSLSKRCSQSVFKGEGRFTPT